MMRQVLESYGAELKEPGKILCPFHDDHNPSAVWSETRFTCFACGVRGTPIGLIMSQEGVSWSEAQRVAEGLTGGSDEPVREATSTGLALPAKSGHLGGNGTTLQARVRR